MSIHGAGDRRRRHLSRHRMSACRRGDGEQAPPLQMLDPGAACDAAPIVLPVSHPCPACTRFSESPQEHRTYDGGIFSLSMNNREISPIAVFVTIAPFRQSETTIPSSPPPLILGGRVDAEPN